MGLKGGVGVDAFCRAAVSHLARTTQRVSDKVQGFQGFIELLAPGV